MYYGNLKNVRGNILKARARELLNFIGLKDKTNVQVRRLSRGEKQKLAICIALIADPMVILLDEPTTGLDVQSSRSIKDKVIEMTRGQGKSALVTTHDMHVAHELCDRIAIINKGELVTCKPTDELLDIFSDQTFEFRLDKLPDAAEFADIDGLHDATPCFAGSCAPTPVSDDDEPMLAVRVDSERDRRSRALYATVARLRERGYLLHSITERQQTLENVFLHLTGGGNETPDETS